MWERLLAILAELLELYQDLLKLSREKREILISGKAQALEAITKKEELLILQIGKLDHMRAAVAQEAGAAVGLTGDQVTLASLQEKAPAPIAERLRKLDADFAATTGELVPLNQVNTQLIQQALNYVNYNINILAQTTTGPTYAPQGQTGQGQPSRVILDTKI